MEKSKKLNTLCENFLFSRLYSKGKSFNGKYLIVYTMKNRRGIDKRIGITVSKSRGKAVVRNRVRRRIRECLRSFYPFIKEENLIVVVARQSAVEASFNELSDDLFLLLKRAALLDEE